MDNRHLKNFIKYSSLNVLGMLGLSCYILADTFFIARGLGSNGLTALNLAIPVYSLIHGCGQMLGMGGGIKYSIFKSQEKHHDANAVFTSTVLLTLLFAALFLTTGLFFSEWATSALGADREVYQMTHTYLKVILLFSPLFLMNNVLLCFVRNDGKPRLTMTAMVTGSLSNILLDYLFIFPLNMGIFGAVLATGFSPMISMLILSHHKFKNANGFHFTRGLPSVQATIYTLLLGFPSLITEIASGVVIFIFNLIILNLQGNVGVAAYGVIANLSFVILSIYTGIAQGVQPLLSHAYGCRDKATIQCTLRYALIATIGFSFLVYLTIFVFAAPLAHAFNSENNPLLQNIAVSGMKIYFTAILFAGFNIILCVFFTSTERAIPAHIISLLRGLLIIIPMTFLLSSLAGMTGIWLSFPVTEILVAIFGGWVYFNKR